MTDKVKLVVSETAVRVECRDGVQTCIFCAEDGREVLFQRSKQGYVIKITDIAVECFTLVDARVLSLQKLTNPYLDKGRNHSVKVLPEENDDLTRRQQVHDAWCHELRMNPWNNDED